MLRTNLATRPFYNVRAVQVVLGALGLLILAFTIFNVVAVSQLSMEQRRLSAHAVEAEQQAQQLRADAARIRTQINQKELEAVTKSAREANRIIDQRAFSWTTLLTQLESTLPDEVRLTAVRPRLDQDGTFIVAVAVEARRVDDLDAFIEALEASGAFRSVLPIQEQTDDEGLIAAIIEGVYTQPTRAVEVASRE